MQKRDAAHQMLLGNRAPPGGWHSVGANGTNVRVRDVGQRVEVQTAPLRGTAVADVYDIVHPGAAGADAALARRQVAGARTTPLHNEVDDAREEVTNR